MSGRSRRPRQSIFSAAVHDPESVRRSLTRFLQMRAIALQMRAEQRDSASLSDRVAMSNVLEKIDGWIYDARAWLAARNLPCPRQEGL